MTPIRRIAFIGNSLPRRCGIATFTTDLQQAISNSRPKPETCIVAMTDHGQAYDYPSSVALQIGDDDLEDYLRAADFLNAGRFDTVCLQHEFGIFGGDAGAHILVLLLRLTMPVVTTFHTVLAEPTIAQRAVMVRIAEISSKVVVMAKKGRELLRSVYQVPDDKIEVIAHGIPDIAFVGPEAAKAKLGFGGKSVVLTFGLLSPNKGIENVLKALPLILAEFPEVVYIVLGATHPNLIAAEGEVYRHKLEALAKELGVSATTDNRKAVRGANIVLLGVKPQVVGDVLKEIKPELGKDTLVISVAASVPTAYIEQRLGEKVAVIRAMPNTCSIVGTGMAGICKGAHASAEHLEIAKALFDAVGRTVVVDEKNMDAVTGLSASGPAFAYIILESLAEAGVKVGLPRDDRLKYLRGSHPLTMSEPAEELRVHGHGDIGGEDPPRNRLGLLARTRDAEEPAEELEVIGRIGERHFCAALGKPGDAAFAFALDRIADERDDVREFNLAFERGGDRSDLRFDDG